LREAIKDLQRLLREAEEQMLFRDAHAIHLALKSLKDNVQQVGICVSHHDNLCSQRRKAALHKQYLSQRGQIEIDRDADVAKLVEVLLRRRFDCDLTGTGVGTA